MEPFGQHSDTLHWFLLNWGFWYFVIAVSIGWFIVIPRHVTQLGRMSPEKVGSLVWFLVTLGFGILHFHGYCWENFSHFSLYRRDTVGFFQIWHMCDTGYRVCFGIVWEVCRLEMQHVMKFFITCHFWYHDIFFLEDPRVSRHMQWIKITCLGQKSSLVADLDIDVNIISLFYRGIAAILTTWVAFPTNLFVLQACFC